MGEQLVLPGTEAYKEANQSYLSACLSDYNPAVFVRPKSSTEVAAFLRLAKDYDIKFAIRGGGQQPLEACSNIDGGVTLDLSLITGVELEDGHVSVGAGEHWLAVYEKVQAAGLAVGGSRSGKGGIGGLSLSEGFICDNVINFEAVTASGDIVQANSHENADLWKALKGGGNNFGVVTRFDLRTYSQKPFWSGIVFYLASEANYPGQVEALVNEVTKPDVSNDTHFMVNLGYSKQFGDSMMGLNQVYYTGQDAADLYGANDVDTGRVRIPPMLEPFTSVQPQIEQLNSFKIQTLVQGATEHAVMSSDRVRCSYMNCTLRANTAALLSAADIYSKAIEPLKAVDGITLCLTLQAYPKSLLNKTAELGGNVLGLPSDEPLVTVLLLTYWKNKENDKKIMATLQEALTDIEKEADSRGQRVPYVYLNYTSQFQDPFTSYGEENRKFLQETSRKYDPEGLFQKNVPGGFKLF
ncbi:hypothetical protein KJ359_000195 [Pestalotiopsis sp. 9143b]|nr:hypothetical protein KJ359_000195 [Pestalotiopsis sp. 9143b]